MTDQKLNRREVLTTLLAGTAVAAGCATQNKHDDIWQGFSTKINARTLAEAEKLLALELSEEERALILDDADGAAGPDRFTEQRSMLTEWRSNMLANHHPPALQFDPRIPGVNYSDQSNRLELSEAAIAAPTDQDQIAFASVRTQAHWIREGHLSSEALTRLYLERISQWDHVLQSFITVTPELALHQARTADRELASGVDRGLLHGIPYGIKDLFDTARVRTTWGAAPYKDRTPTTDASIVVLLREAGAVLLGKTALGALAWGDVWFDGITRNPWNPEEGSSGSSAGSAAATVAGFCSFAIGSETWGSIVSPSTRCGAVGLRPTFGRVPRRGAMSLCWSLDKAGPICRYSQDTAIVLAAINQHDASEPGSIAMGFDYQAGLKDSRLSVGYDPQWLENVAEDDPIHTALKVLENTSIKLSPIELPELPWDILIPLLECEAGAAFSAFSLGPNDDAMRRQVANAWPNVFRASRFFSAVDYIHCDRLRRDIMQAMHNFFAQVDVVIGPSSGHAMTALTNLTGHPGMAIPAGFAATPSRPIFEDSAPKKPTHQVPVAVYLWTALFNESAMITIGNILESELGYAGSHPGPQLWTPRHA